MQQDLESMKNQIKENIQILINDNKLDEASVLIDEYFKMIDNDVEAYSMKAVILIMKGHIDDAEYILLNGLNYESYNFDLNYNLGYIYYNKKEYELGLQYYKKAYMNTYNYEIKQNIKGIIREMLLELNLNEDVEAFLYSNLDKSEQNEKIENKNEVEIFSRTPLVSICIPVYNCEKYIYEAVKSAIDQTYQNIEIIILDNCSNDRTGEIINSIKDDRIKHYRLEEQIFAFDNWNYCAKLAKGKYIKYLFSDDMLNKECVYKLVDIMESNEDVVIASGDVAYINDKSEITQSNILRNKQLFTGKYSGKDILKKSIIENNVIGCPSNVMIRKFVFDKIKGFNTRYTYCVDDFLYYRLFEQGSYYFVNEELTKFRSHLGKGVDTLSVYTRVEEFYSILEDFLNNDLFSEEEIKQAYHNVMNRCLYSFSINKNIDEKIKIIDKIISSTKFIDAESLSKLNFIKKELLEDYSFL